MGAQTRVTHNSDFHILGVAWVGVNLESGRKLVLSIVFIVGILILSAIARALVGLVLGRTNITSIRAKFWTRQGVSLLSAMAIILGVMSIWFSDPTRLATAFGLVSAGLALRCSRWSRRWPATS